MPSVARASAGLLPLGCQLSLASVVVYAVTVAASAGAPSSSSTMPAGPRRVDVDAGAHRRRQRDRAGCSGPSRRTAWRGRSRRSAPRSSRAAGARRSSSCRSRQVDVGAAVGAVLELAGLRLLNGLGDVHRHRAGLRVRHLAARAEDPAELADDCPSGRASRPRRRSRRSPPRSASRGRPSRRRPRRPPPPPSPSRPRRRRRRATRLPVPCGSISVPRSCWSA